MTHDIDKEANNKVEIEDDENISDLDFGGKCLHLNIIRFYVGRNFVDLFG